MSAEVEIRFDDIEALQRMVSEQYGPWGRPLRITQSMIDHFAEITDDRQWIHVDVDRARRESPFGGTIAHGFLTLAMATTISRGGVFRIVGHGSAANYGLDGVRFIAPVPSEGLIHARSRLDAVQAKPTGTLLTKSVEVRVVEAAGPALIFQWKLLYRP